MTDTITDWSVVWFFGLIVMVIALKAGFLAGRFHEDNKWRVDAIKRGFAEYDSVTGKWRWKEPPRQLFQ